MLGFFVSMVGDEKVKVEDEEKLCKKRMKRRVLKRKDGSYETVLKLC